MQSPNFYGYGGCLMVDLKNAVIKMSWFKMECQWGD